uniref:Serpin domain-containing protein n=1 Tax=Panagrolaimus sp. PS1159 TaxID=55785 RepID=A0AC35FXD3_9BILA
MSDKEILIAATLLKSFDPKQNIVFCPSVICKALNTGNLAEIDEPKIEDIVCSICLVISKEKPLPNLFFDQIKKRGNHLLSVDYQNPVEASEMINSFVFHQTKKIIQKLVYANELNKDISCLIGSASTLSGQWDYPFEKTVTSTFYSNPPRQIQFICQKEGIGWNIEEQEDWKCHTIPYCNNQIFHICLPKQKDGLQNLINNFDETLIRECCRYDNLMEVNTKIPVIDIETRINLKDKEEALLLPSELFQTFGTQILSLHTGKFMINEYGTYTEAFKDDGARCAANFKKADFTADYPFLFFCYSSCKCKQLFYSVYWNFCIN